MAEENWIYSPSGIGYNWRYNPQAYAEAFARNANQISNILITKWDDAGSLKADLMESAEHVAGQAWLKRTTPLVCPESDFLFLGSMTKVESFPERNTTGDYGVQVRDDETGWWKHDRIGYQCTFINLPYQVKEDDEVKSLAEPELNRYCTVHPMPVVQNRVVSGKQFIIDGGAEDGQGVNETAAVPEVLTRFLIKQWMWPYAAIPWSVISSRSGKVNSGSFTIKGTTYAAERLLYEGLGSQPEEYHGPDGQKYVDVVHSVIVHPENWNKTYWKGSYQYIKLRDSSPAIRRFQTASFSEIFKPA
jgi:hypothetical protein